VKKSTIALTVILAVVLVVGACIYLRNKVSASTSGGGVSLTAGCTNLPVKYQYKYGGGWTNAIAGKILEVNVGDSFDLSGNWKYDYNLEPVVVIANNRDWSVADTPTFTKNKIGSGCGGDSSNPSSLSCGIGFNITANKDSGEVSRFTIFLKNKKTGQFSLPSEFQMKAVSSLPSTPVPTPITTATNTIVPVVPSISFDILDMAYDTVISSNAKSITIKQGESFHLRINLAKTTTKAPIYQLSNPLTTVAHTGNSSDNYLEAQVLGGAGYQSITFHMTAKQTGNTAKVSDRFLVSDIVNGRNYFTINIEP